MAYTIVPASGTSTPIVNLNATPAVRSTAGQGGSCEAYILTASAVAPVNFPTTNFLPMIRIPSNSIVHKLEISLDTYPSTSLEFDVGMNFSSALDGTQPQYMSTYALTGATPTLLSLSFFAFNYSVSTSGAPGGLWTDITFQNMAGNSATDGYYVPSASTKPLWQALGAGGIGGVGKATAGPSSGVGNAFASCQADPFGFFDITIFSSVTGVNTAAVNLSLRCTFSNAAAS